MSNTKNTKNKEQPKKQPNALLTFVGEQDLDYFRAALAGVIDLDMDQSGGSRELSLRAENDHIVIGIKKELTI